MSITAQTTSKNLTVSCHSYYFRAFWDNTENISRNSDSFPHCGVFRVMHQYPIFLGLSYYQDYTNGNKYAGANLLNEICVDSDKHFEEEMDATESGISSKDFEPVSEEECSTSDAGGPSKIWRPFSPPPSFETDNAVENNASKENSQNLHRTVFHSIKPSNVKIGLSKNSVFKAVQKSSYNCTQCRSRYVSNRQLNAHMRVHTGSKPFRCEYPNCFKSFSRNEELTRHKRIHSGFKPHLCTTCKKRFGRKDHLSKHLKTHLQTSEKKIYQCSFPGCGHRYTRSDALTRHKSTAHATKNQK